MSVLIPIEIDCSVTHYLRKKKKRFQAFPFDWNVTPISSAIHLIQNNFVDFLKRENLVFLPSTNRMLFEENGVDLKVSHEIITPVVDRKYKILLPHDFSAKGEDDLDLVKQKYERRIQRLKRSLEESREVVFIYNFREPNDWQLNQYKLSKVVFSMGKSENLGKQFVALKNQYSNIKFVTLKSFRASTEPFDFIKEPLKRMIIKSGF